MGLNPKSWAMRRVKGYDWVDGMVLIHMSEKMQKDEPFVIPISEKEARFYGWKPPSERHKE